MEEVEPVAGPFHVSKRAGDEEKIPKFEPMKVNGIDISGISLFVGTGFGVGCASMLSFGS